jgi:hypothetical protein
MKCRCTQIALGIAATTVSPSDPNRAGRPRYRRWPGAPAGPVSLPGGRAGNRTAGGRAEPQLPGARTPRAAASQPAAHRGARRNRGEPHRPAGSGRAVLATGVRSAGAICTGQAHSGHPGDPAAPGEGPPGTKPCKAFRCPHRWSATTSSTASSPCSAPEPSTATPIAGACWPALTHPANGSNGSTPSSAERMRISVWTTTCPRWPTPRFTT